MRVPSSLKGPLLALASLVVCALAIEGAALAIEARRVRRVARALREGGPLVRYHPLLGWEKTPGSERLVERPEFTVHFKHNAHGLRGPERDYAKPADVRRVLLLGDSFAAGYYAEEPETLRAVLEDRLSRACRSRWEVINGGTIAYSTDQELIFFTSEGRRYAPDVVVLLFYYNDLIFNLSARGPGGEHKPYFELPAGELVLQNVPVPRPAPSEHNRQNPGVGRLRPWRGSMALRLLSRRTARSSVWLHGLLARVGLVPRLSRNPPREQIVYRGGPEVHAMWRVTAALLEQLAQEIRVSGARPMVLYVPARFEVNEAAWRLTRDRFGLGPDWSPERVYSRLAEVCRALDVPLVDPRAALRAAEQQPGAPAYYTYDAHWTAVGHRVAAEVLEARVREASCEASGPAQSPSASSTSN